MTEETQDQFQEEIVSYLVGGKKVRDQLGDIIENQYLFSGKTLAQWRQEFHIQFRDDMDPQSIVDAGARISMLNWEASFNFNNAKSTCMAIEADYKRRRNEKVNEIIASLGNAPKNTRPSIEAIKEMAEVQLQEIQSMLVNAQIVRDFWDNLREHLSLLRYNLNTINNSLINQRKIEKE